MTYMKLPYLVFLLVFLPFATFSQVGIGTDTPAPGTALHIKDITGTSGVLFPKVDIADLTTVAPLPAGTENGTIVYNTNTTTGEGYYYFLASNWERIFGTIGGMAKFTNALSSTGSTNLNLGGTNAEISRNTVFNDNAVIYQSTLATPNTVIVGEAGRYKVIVNLSLVATSPNATQRLLAVEGRLRINGIITGGIYRSSEMISPNSTTPDYGSITFTEIVNLAVNDQLTVFVSRTQDAGNVYLRSANTSSIFIERLD